MELRLCFVTSLLLEKCCVSASVSRPWEEGFGSKYKPYFTLEMDEGFARCSVSIIGWFFVIFGPIAGLLLSKVKLKIVGTAPFFSTSE